MARNSTIIFVLAALIQLSLGYAEFADGLQGFQKRKILQTSVTCTTVGEKFADDSVDDCSAYFKCITAWDGAIKPARFTCQPPTIYDKASKSCSNSAVCTTSTTPGGPTSTKAPPPTCPGDGARIANTDEPGCTQYYLCISTASGLIASLIDCPEGQKFNPDTGSCEADYNCPDTSTSSATPTTTPSPTTPTPTPSTTPTTPTTTITTPTPTPSTTSITTTLTTTTTTSSPSTNNCTQPGRFPDYSVANCKGYFVCSVQPGDILVGYGYECIGETWFDPYIALCSTTYVCPKSTTTTSTTTTTTTPKPTTTTTVQTTTVSSEPSCKQPGKFPDPRVPGCKGYIQCSLQPDNTLAMYAYTCLGSTWFNPTLANCYTNYVCP